MKTIKSIPRTCQHDHKPCWGIRAWDMYELVSRPRKYTKHWKAGWDKKHSASANLRHTLFEERETVKSDVKQSRQLSLGSCPTYRENFRKILPAVSYNVVNMDPENRKSCIQGIKRKISKMLKSVPCVISDLSWKFNKNPVLHFFHNVADRNTAPPNLRNVKQSSQSGNSLDNCIVLLYRTRSILKMLWKAVDFFP